VGEGQNAATNAYLESSMERKPDEISMTEFVLIFEDLGMSGRSWRQIFLRGRAAARSGCSLCPRDGGTAKNGMLIDPVMVRTTALPRWRLKRT